MKFIFQRTEKNPKKINTILLQEAYSSGPCQTLKREPFLKGRWCKIVDFNAELFLELSCPL